MSVLGGNEHDSKFSYIYCCDVDTDVRIKIGTLEGERKKPGYQALIDDPLLRFSGLYQEGCSHIYVTCQIFSDGVPLALPVQTSYKPFTSRWNWNEWLTLPMKFCDLPRDALLTFTIWDVYGPRKAVPVGGTSVNLFGKYGALKQGMMDLRVWPDVEGDGVGGKTPGKADGKREQMSRLAKLTKKHRNGRMAKVDWLDRLTFREIELIHEREKRSSNFMFLMIEFPHFVFYNTEYTVVYFEKGGEESCHNSSQGDIVVIPDPEISMENLVENKHHKLVRGIRSGLSDKDLKPNALTRDQLNVIVSYPPTKVLTSEEQDLVWKFRFYLTSSKKALTKFLKCVNWKLVAEAKQALDLLDHWQAMDVEDALELLSPQFTHPAVRRYAVTRLQQAPDEDLLLYLLQLVQALKYENFDDIRAGLESTQSRQDSTSEGERERSVTTISDILQRRNSTLDSEMELPNGLEQLDTPAEHEADVTSSECDLATFLINRACANDTLANYFYWYLLVECEDQNSADLKIKEMYIIVMKRFSQALLKGGYEYRKRRSLLSRQQTFVDRLVSLMKTVARESGTRMKKIEKLHALLSDPEVFKMNFTSFEPLLLPLDTDVVVKGIIPERATLFKSALMPCKLTFLTIENTEYFAIFKHGDDLRQDQLILQTITLMDKLLRRENLDLKLIPYKVLATSTKHGFVQYIESTPVAEIIESEGSIQNYLRKIAPSENGPYGITPEVMDVYVKSLAGYCVITYLLGVGDRHLDNVLLTRTGNVFHVDFGYILGRDPKPMQAPMKLHKEMVEGMGGINSDHYQEFRKECYTAFLHLRRHANLILNLFSLMTDANVPDIALEPDKTVKKVQDKFLLDLTDEEAVHYMQNLIDISVSAVITTLVEQIHRIAQRLRN